MRWHETQTLYNLADSELVFTALAVIFLAVYLSSDRMHFHATCTGTKCVCVTGLVKFKMCQIRNVSNYKIRSDAVNLFDCSDCYSGVIVTTDKSQILRWHRVQRQSKAIFKGMTSFRKLLTFGPLFYLWLENHWRKYLSPEMLYLQCHADMNVDSCIISFLTPISLQKLRTNETFQPINH